MVKEYKSYFPYNNVSAILERRRKPRHGVFADMNSSQKQQLGRDSLIAMQNTFKNTLANKGGAFAKTAVAAAAK